MRCATRRKGQSLVKKLSEKGVEQCSERGFALTLRPNRAVSESCEATFRASAGLFRQFQGELRLSPGLTTERLRQRRILLSLTGGEYGTRRRRVQGGQRAHNGDGGGFAQGGAGPRQAQGARQAHGLLPGGPQDADTPGGTAHRAGARRGRRRHPSPHGRHPAPTRHLRPRRASKRVVDGEKFYTVEEAAWILKPTPGRIRPMLRAGELEGRPSERVTNFSELRKTEVQLRRFPLLRTPVNRRREGPRSVRPGPSPCC